jgi:UDP-3-O-[3-hydroxymyristoyl] glucosamine N-acyltransferase
MYNCRVGQGCFLAVENIFSSIVGDETFIGGRTGFSDFNINRSNISAATEEERIQTSYFLLGCCIGKRVTIGGQVAFAPGLAIPCGSYFLNPYSISELSREENSLFVQHDKKVLKMPRSLLTKSGLVSSSI